MLYSGAWSNPFQAYPLACLQQDLLELGTEEASQGRSLTFIQRRLFNACQAQSLSLVNQNLSFISSLSPWGGVIDSNILCTYMPIVLQDRP